jgi:hypothetical protein
MKVKFLFLGLVLSLFTVSCTKDTADNSIFTADEATVNAKIDLANDDVSDIVEGQFETTMFNSISGKTTKTAINTLTNIPTCATITRVPAFGTAPTVGQTVTKTIDFGTTGCAMPNGNILKGKINISFVYDPTASSHTINYEFVNFYHNAIKIDGNKTFTRNLSVATATSASHPIVVMNMQLTATFADGRVFNRVGTRTREIVEGYGTPLVLADNIYKVTGNWTTTFPNTTQQTSTITTPLLVKMSCIAVKKPLLVKGVITFVRNGNSATLDYGNGDCDNIAVFTINGNSYTITIGN